MAYATTTSVSVEKTGAEIKATIKRYGATAFATFEGKGEASIAFTMRDRNIRFNLPLPAADDKAFVLDGRGRQRTADSRYAAWEQACRSKWRALLLCIKAKLESVDSGIETFESAFLANIQMPNGDLVGDVAKLQIARAYEGGDTTLRLSGPAN